MLPTLISISIYSGIMIDHKRERETERDYVFVLPVAREQERRVREIDIVPEA